MLPATRFAVDAYVRFVREKTLLEAVAASLTELFAPAIHAARIEGLLANYEFADDSSSLSYFRNRLKEAPKDVAFGLAWVLDRADTAEKQDAAAAALTFKTDVLWTQLDALDAAYVAPARIPPGAWQPGEGLRRGPGGADARPPTIAGDAARRAAAFRPGPRRLGAARPRARGAGSTRSGMRSCRRWTERSLSARSSRTLAARYSAPAEPRSAAIATRLPRRACARSAFWT